MKTPTNRVLQHRSAARTSPQVKTSRNHQPENVRILISEVKGEPAADFEIPLAAYQAMLRDVVRAGISVRQWIENAVRDKIGRSKPAENPPAIIRLNEVPEDTRDQALAACDELEKCASAAVALAVMQARQIKFCTDCFAGWEDLEMVLFQAGNLELPRLLAENFRRDFSAWRDEMTGTANEVQGPCRVSNNIENGVNALAHLIDLQGTDISVRNDNSAFAASFIIKSSLELAFDRAWKAAHKTKTTARVLPPEKIPQAA